MIGNIKYIIGLVGKKQSGKDTFYRACMELYLEKRIFIPVQRFAFADELKKEVAQKMGWSVEELNKRKVEARKELQEVGVKRREEDKEYWIKCVAAKLMAFERKPFNRAGMSIPHIVLLTDTRFLNEADWLKSLGAKLIKINRANDGDYDADKHISETELESIRVDWSIVNEGIGRYNLYKAHILDALKQLNMTE